MGTEHLATANWSSGQESMIHLSEQGFSKGQRRQEKNSADGCRCLQRHDHGDPNKFQIPNECCACIVVHKKNVGRVRSRQVEMEANANSTYVE